MDIHVYVLTSVVVVLSIRYTMRRRVRQRRRKAGFNV
jgi:hypothetical protein